MIRRPPRSTRTHTLCPDTTLCRSATYGHIATTYAYPVMVGERYVMDPSPIPKFDNPKLDMSPALMLFGAGREKRLYAVPPYTAVTSLDFDDHPFDIPVWEHNCAFCGSSDSYRSDGHTSELQSLL